MILKVLCMLILTFFIVLVVLMLVDMVKKILGVYKREP